MGSEAGHELGQLWEGEGQGGSGSAAVHGFAKSRTRLGDWNCLHCLGMVLNCFNSFAMFKDPEWIWEGWGPGEQVKKRANDLMREESENYCVLSLG